MAKYQCQCGCGAVVEVGDKKVPTCCGKPMKIVKSKAKASNCSC